MKFANYHHIGKNMNNLGDQVQILAIDYIYQQMGIKKNDIVYIDMDELRHYNGCPVILPVSMPLINYNEHGIAGMFSEKITPVFLGLTLAKDFLRPEEVAYYKNQRGLCPNAEDYYESCLTLPLFYDMTDGDQQDVVQAVRKVIGHYLKE